MESKELNGVIKNIKIGVWVPAQLHLTWSLLQMFSSDAVNTGVGVYWMFYTGGSFEPVPTPAGLPGLPEGQELEGLR